MRSVGIKIHKLTKQKKIPTSGEQVYCEVWDGADHDEFAGSVESGDCQSADYCKDPMCDTGVNWLLVRCIGGKTKMYYMDHHDSVESIIVQMEQAPFPSTEFVLSSFRSPDGCRCPTQAPSSTYRSPHHALT